MATWVCGHSLAGIASSNSARAMDVCPPCECYVLSGIGLCVGLMACPGESYQVWCCLSVIVQPR